MPTVRGHEYGKRFPAESPHEVIVIPEYDFHRTLSQFMPYRSRDPIVLGRDVFWWIPIVPADSLEKVAWLMVFYGGVAVIGYTGMKFGGDQKGVETFKQIIRKKGSRERYLKEDR